MRDINQLKSLVQNMLEDEAAKNRILGYNEEYPIDMVDKAHTLVLLEINSGGGYRLDYTLQTCPDYLLLLGVAKQLLSKAITVKTRNTTSTGSAGEVNREGNLKLYYNLYSELNIKYNDLLDQTRDIANLEGAMR